MSKYTLINISITVGNAKIWLMMVLVSVFFIFIKSANADQAAHVRKIYADQAVVILKEHSEIRFYCAPCRDKEYKDGVVEKVFSKPVDDSDWWKVIVNGRGVDLAYIYFRKDGVWRNMALYLKMEYITDVPETIPEVFVDKWKYINPETIIQDCRDASREHFSHGTTAHMEAGRRGIVICLENAIITHASILLEEKDFPPEVIRSELKKLRESYGRLYWGMYNDNKKCGVSCGSFNDSLHLSHTAKLDTRINPIIFHFGDVLGSFCPICVGIHAPNGAGWSF